MLALGIDLTRGAIAIGLVETSGRAPRLVGSWREERDAGRTAAEQLRAMIDRHCTQRPDAIASALPGSAVSHRVLRLPFSDAGRLAATVPFELESLVPFDVESGVIAFTALERDGAGATVLAAIAQRRDVKQHLDLLADAGVDPAVVDLGTLAVAALLRPRTTDLLLVEPRDDGGVCLVRHGHLAAPSTSMRSRGASRPSASVARSRSGPTRRPKADEASRAGFTSVPRARSAARCGTRSARRRRPSRP